MNKVTQKNISVMIPCYNEAITIRDVVISMNNILPNASIYVFDNNSTDDTAKIAESAGAQVIKEMKKGKGFVVQSMFKKIDGDIFVMVDGDDTYDLSNLPDMISKVKNNEADMITGNRLAIFTKKSFRPLHTFGNKLVRTLINVLFKSNLKDIMTGFRVMNSSFVKNINIMSSGFEVETEMTIKALKYGYAIKEVDVKYKERPEGSFSKLNTFKDGLLVLKTIFSIFKNYKPLLFFSICALIMFIIATISGSIVISEFAETKYITHVPLAIFATGSMIFSIIIFITGIILDVINKRFDELYTFMKK